MRKIQILLLICFIPAVILHAQVGGWVKAGKLQLYYEKKGNGPPLLFLHGGFLDHRMWKRQVDFFSGQYCVITPDLPGHGVTSGVDTSIAIAEVIRIFMDSLHIARASFVGLSLGSLCATEFVLAHPERVDRIILSSPGLSGWDDVLHADTISRAMFARMDSAFASKDKERIARVFTELWCNGPFRTANTVRPEIREYVYHTAINSQEHHPNEAWPVFRKNPRAIRLLASIHRPVLLLYGDLDEPLITGISNYIHEQVKGSQLLGLKGAAHMLNMELPEQFNRVILDFLKNDRTAQKE